jgi:hypothetical protein
MQYSLHCILLIQALTRFYVNSVCYVQNFVQGVVIFLLLISGSFVYLRKKKAAAMSGYVVAGRGQANSRF